MCNKIFKNKVLNITNFNKINKVWYKYMKNLRLNKEW